MHLPSIVLASEELLDSSKPLTCIIFRHGLSMMGIIWAALCPQKLQSGNQGECIDSPILKPGSTTIPLKLQPMQGARISPKNCTKYMFWKDIKSLFKLSR